MVRTVDYESRRRAVLASAINRYIRQAQPVSSEELVKEFGLSSATVRNIFSELEEAGYLTHPYTSGGRVPTDKGYRYYVDLLAQQMQLLDEEKESIANQYRREIRRLEDALDQTSEVISGITHYAGIVSFMDWQDRYFLRGISRIIEQPEFSDLKKLRMLLQMVEDKERFLKLMNRRLKGKSEVYIGAELECPGMQGCSLVVASYNFRKKPSGRVAVLGPARMEYNHIIPALEYISECLSGMLEDI